VLSLETDRPCKRRTGQ